MAVYPGLHNLCVFDLNVERAVQFKHKCLDTFEQLEICVEKDINNVFKKCALISFATTATQPYVSDLSACTHETTILHVSLRDLAPEVILSCDNVADDISHVCRAGTSLHLAEQLSGIGTYPRNPRGYFARPHSGQKKWRAQGGLQPVRAGRAY